MHARSHIRTVAAGEVGQRASTQERVENERKDSCPLRGASQCGSRDMLTLARVVRTRTQSPAQNPCPAIRCMRKAHCQSMRDEATWHCHVVRWVKSNVEPCYFHFVSYMECVRYTMTCRRIQLLQTTTAVPALTLNNPAAQRTKRLEK